MRGLAVVALWVGAGLGVFLAAGLFMFNGYVEDSGTPPAVTWPYALGALAVSAALFILGLRLLRDPPFRERNASRSGEGAGELGENGD